jgi:hypothetical protein
MDTPRDIANGLSRAEADALERLDQGRHTDEAVRLNRTSIDSLIEKRLVRPDGVAFVSTERGREVLQHLR